MSQEDWAQGGKEVASQTVTFGKVGDFIKGTYTGQKMINTMNGDTPLYEVKAIVGNFHTVDDKKNPVEPPVLVEEGAYYNVWGSLKPTSGANAITGLFAKSRVGDIVAIQLEKEVSSKTKGNAPFKKYKTMQFGADPSYMGETADALQDTFPGAEEVVNA